MTSLVLIKNLDSEHLETFRATGRVLLSSLQRLRELEGVGRDELEGNKSVQCKPTKPKTYRSEAIEQLFSGNIIIQGGYFHAAPGSTINIGTRLPEAYVFCTSTHREKKFGNASYQILDVHRFATVLFKSLKVRDHKVYGYALGKVRYGGLKDTIDNLDIAFQLNYSGKDVKLEDYFCKPSSFASEGEYRYVFFTLTDPIQDKMLIESLELVTLCSL